MLVEYSLPQFFWAEVTNTTCHVLNRTLIRPILKKTPYELWKSRKPTIAYFKVFGCKYFILNTKDHLGKFDSKSDEAIFLGYSTHSKAYRVYNRRTQTVEEFVHVDFDETDPFSKGDRNSNSCVDDEEDKAQEDEKKSNEAVNSPSSPSISRIRVVEEEVAVQQEDNVDQDEGEPSVPSLPRRFKHASSHPMENIISDPSQRIQTQSSLRFMSGNAFLSLVEPKSFKEAEVDEFWMITMQEELNQFTRNQVWELVPKPNHQSVIGTKWVFKNKNDENGLVVRNKARLAAQGYSQFEGIDYDETFAPMARLESIRMLLAHASYVNFPLFQMDVKSAFLNGYIQEEVYVAQPPGFHDYEFPDHVYKLRKALYGLKQAP